MRQELALRDFCLAFALLAIGVFFAAQSPVFLSVRNLSLLMIELSVMAILALGMRWVLFPGKIELSTGSGVGMLEAIAAVLVFDKTWPAPQAIATAWGIVLVVCGLVGAVW